MDSTRVHRQKKLVIPNTTQTSKTHHRLWRLKPDWGVRFSHRIFSFVNLNLNVTPCAIVQLSNCPTVHSVPV